MTTEPLQRKPLLTPANAHTMAAIREIIANTGDSPTVKEVADATGVSHSSAYAQLMTLERKGVITREEGKARSIRVVE